MADEGHNWDPIPAGEKDTWNALWKTGLGDSAPVMDCSYAEDTISVAWDLSSNLISETDPCIPSFFRSSGTWHRIWREVYQWECCGSVVPFLRQAKAFRVPVSALQRQEQECGRSLIHIAAKSLTMFLVGGWGQYSGTESQPTGLRFGRCLWCCKIRPTCRLFFATLNKHVQELLHEWSCNIHPKQMTLHVQWSVGFIALWGGWRQKCVNFHQCELYWSIRLLTGPGCGIMLANLIYRMVLDRHSIGDTWHYYDAD